MLNSFFQIVWLVLPTTGLTFGGILYGLMLHRHPKGMILAFVLGLLCGLIFGVGIGYFCRRVEHEVRVDSVGVLGRQIAMVLQRMGYSQEHVFNKVVTYRPTLRAGLFADRIRVETMSGCARIEGPHKHVEHLISKLGF
ncbi:MAG: hypothetical protein EKK41_20180 [Hyphomicrobiales bacterium]|nr:MAG: hypothetical protein EKK41_20180 [Hyphomicrobiales bacterium]